MDDPFASVDAPTARVIMEKLLQGPLMAGRTCIVTTQPDSERLQKFNRVVRHLVRKDATGKRYLMM